MEKFLFAPLLVRKLEQDDFYRRLFAGLFTAAAVLISVATVISFVFGWKEIFDMSAQAMTGGIVFQGALILAAYQAVHLTLMRANEVKRESDRPATIAVPVIAARLAGEIYGFSATLLGIGGGVLVWLAGRESGSLLKRMEALFPFLKSGPASFFGGATLIIKGIGYGMLTLLVAYLVAELLLALPLAAKKNLEGVENA